MDLSRDDLSVCRRDEMHPARTQATHDLVALYALDRVSVDPRNADLFAWLQDIFSPDRWAVDRGDPSLPYGARAVDVDLEVDVARGSPRVEVELGEVVPVLHFALVPLALPKVSRCGG
jgi:hypothetical protein